jgi:serine/threonine-protein kinase RsbW
MEVTYVLCLPRDAASVPFVRHMLRSSMERLGVVADCISDIEIAVSEACTNVLRHAGEAHDAYEVTVRTNDSECEISVSDAGGSLDVSALRSEEAGPGAESGRGVFLMKYLADDLHFVSDPDNGTVVRLRKKLELRPDSVLGRLSRSAAPPHHQ